VKRALFWLVSLAVAAYALLLRLRPSAPDRAQVLKAEAERLKKIADERRAAHDAEAKAAVQAIAEERAKPVDSVDFANDLLKE